MFSHIMLGADDIDASKTFYDAIFAATGVGPGITDDKGRVFWMTPTGVFAITRPIDGRPASCGNGSTVGFAMKSPAEADAWHAAGLANGGTACEDPPGVRTGPTGSLYLAYLRDPSGNKLCALHRM
jgi:catechol 2,3-dioxygenase-like lactoylglutathione lyase family enzyme